jgi:urease accessory protein
MTLPALAHPGHGPADGFMAGFYHPFGGLDHLLAMLAVGLWAAIRGGAAMWGWPAAFVVAMVGGFAFAMHGVVLPVYEPMILASLVGLGLAIVLGQRMPLAAGAALVALFGLFHGYAHGIEVTGSAISFAAGFAAASVMLHAAGLALGRLAEQSRHLMPLRVSGAAIALAGIVLPMLEYLK